jgi:hypothetical protein
MWTILFGVFLILHGLVHLLYAGQSWRFFELRPELTWPDGAWLFSKLLRNETIRLLASIALVLAALGLVASGLGLFFRADWWRTVAIASSIISSLLFFVMWNGKFHELPDQGFVGILISIAILALILIFKLPA